ncbi:MAG: peptidoglycan DD-metalloendopeptidase family protein [Candidatus Margulisbacteria bacterium]|nr:peptidoglycan DD-metalloendopeptidase family protein [Candidatus Margulisiibacteriota bacterium]
MLFRVLLLFSLLLALAPADSIADKQKELQRLQSELQRNQRLLQQTKVKENASLRDLTLLSRSLNKVQNELKYNQQKLTQHTQVLQQTSEELNRNDAEYRRRLSLSRLRIREMYKTQDLGWLTLLLTNRSFSSLVENTYYYRRLLGRDLQNLEQVRSIKQDIARKKENLEYQKNIIESTKKSIEQQKQLYEQRTRRQEQLHASLRAERLKYEREADSLLKNSQEVEAMLKKMILENPRAEARGSGKYIWPVRGVITSLYGKRVHPIFKVAKMHTGLDIGVAHGTPIKAADSGVVTYSDWWGGYGRCVILDHGRGYSTLYAHMSKQEVKKGEKVNKGQTIGNVGATGYATGPHLHFEVRLNGETVNPQQYLP